MSRLRPIRRGQIITHQRINAIQDELRSLRVTPGYPLMSRTGSGGTELYVDETTSQGGSSGSPLIPVKITANISAATYTSTSVSPGSGSCERIPSGGGSFGASESIYSYYPDSIPSPSFGWAMEDDLGQLWVVTQSCSGVPA